MDTTKLGNLLKCFSKLGITNKNKEIVPISPETKIKLKKSFKKCVRGYHIVNSDPIKEAPWEDINGIILSDAGYDIKWKSSGSHESGKDLECDLGSFSNKSSQYSPNNDFFKISSYRLTKVCSGTNNGEIQDIIAEIEKRKNFDYYSIIVRSESGTEITYEWYLIPSEHYLLNPASYKWKKKLYSNGKKTGSVSGWETELLDGSYMTISFAMSSQLWIHIKLTDSFKEFIISRCTVTKKRKMNYIELYSLMNQ